MPAQTIYSSEYWVKKPALPSEKHPNFTFWSYFWQVPKLISGYLSPACPLPAVSAAAERGPGRAAGSSAPRGTDGARPVRPAPAPPRSRLQRGTNGPGRDPRAGHGPPRAPPGPPRALTGRAGPGSGSGGRSPPTGETSPLGLTPCALPPPGQPPAAPLRAFHAAACPRTEETRRIPPLHLKSGGTRCAAGRGGAGEGRPRMRVARLHGRALRMRGSGVWVWGG